MPAHAPSRNRPPSSRRTDPPSERRSAGPFHRRKLFRHLVLAAVSAALVWVFWQTRSNWVAEMRLWKALGDAAYVLLLVALSLGPLSKLIPSTRGWLRWRRQVGIWFALTATVHSFLILNGWALWSLRRFLGYEFIPQLGREARLEPGFGLANIIGSVALVLAMVLAATSSDLALRRLGRPAWSWLHRLAQTVLVLALLHGGYFLFMHYTVSFHKAPLPNLDWFRIPFLTAGLAVIGMQTMVFVRSTESRDALTARR
jgi:methionine sulfoxide reductase heme-binding subunit